MNFPLSVLLLEDNPGDAVLALHYLHEAGFETNWRRVENESEFLAQLDPEPNIILADYHLPQFDALRALELLQKRALDIPVIVVTGSLGDEAAAKCMRWGAADYLLKDRLAGLGDAVRQALEKKQARDDKRRAEEALQQAHTELEDRVRRRTAELSAMNKALKTEVAERTRLQQTLAEKVRELEEALAQVKHLRGLLPICMYCKKIRDDQNYWHQVEEYVGNHTDAQFTHGICPACLEGVLRTGV